MESSKTLRDCVQIQKMWFEKTLWASKLIWYSKKRSKWKGALQRLETARRNFPTSLANTLAVYWLFVFDGRIVFVSQSQFGELANERWSIVLKERGSQNGWCKYRLGLKEDCFLFLLCLTSPFYQTLHYRKSAGNISWGSLRLCYWNWICEEHTKKAQNSVICLFSKIRWVFKIA